MIASALVEVQIISVRAFTAAELFTYEVHRRLMLVAATVLLVAAVARLPFLPVEPFWIHAKLIVWSVPILLAIAYDFSSRRPFHPVYVFGLGALLVRNYSVFLSQTDAWSAITRWATSLVL